MNTEKMDSEIREVIKRLNEFGNTTCSDTLVKQFGYDEKGRDDFIRYFRDKFGVRIWLKICSGEGHTAIITLLDKYDTDKTLGLNWSVKNGRVQ